jgi:hypothetical protein
VAKTWLGFVSSGAIAVDGRTVSPFCIVQFFTTDARYSSCSSDMLGGYPEKMSFMVSIFLPASCRHLLFLKDSPTADATGSLVPHSLVLSSKVSHSSFPDHCAEAGKLEH